MGSLMPGWNTTAPGVPPKELRDYDDHAAQPRESYFSKLSKQRSLKHGDSLSSSDQNQDASLLGRSPTAGSPPEMRTLQRASTLPKSQSDSLAAFSSPARLRAATANPVSASPRTPRSPPNLSRKSAPLTGAELRKEEEKKKDAIHKPFQWWRKFSSAHLNEMPDTADPNNWRRSPYVPQYSVTGQKMQYIDSEAAMGTKAGEEKGNDSPKVPETPPAVPDNPAHRQSSAFISVH